MRDLAVGWNERTLGDVVDPARGITYGIVQPGPRQADGNGVALIRGQDYSAGEVSAEGLYWVRPDIAAAYRRSTVHGGDLLLSIVGYVGLAAQVPQVLSGANITQTTARVAIVGRNEAKYFLHYFRSSEFASEVRRYTKGSAQPGLNLADVAVLCVRQPPLPEQRQIAAILDTIDDTIRKTELVIAKLHQVKQGMVHDLLTRGIDETGELRDPEQHPEQFKDSPLGRIPKEWEVDGLTRWNVQLIDGDRGAEYPQESEFSSEGYCAFLSAKNVTKDGFRFDDVAFITEEKHRRLRKGTLMPDDIVVTTRGTLGNFAYFDGSVPVSVLRINSGMVIIRNSDPSIATAFLYEVLRAPMTERQVAVSAYGSAQPQLNLDILRRLSIVHPPLDEQHGLTERVRSLNVREKQETAGLAKLRLLKCGLMEDLLTGQVRVTKLLEDAAE